MTATSSQPSSPQLSRICFVACTSSGTVAYSHFFIRGTLASVGRPAPQATRAVRRRDARLVLRGRAVQARHRRDLVGRRDRGGLARGGEVLLRAGEPLGEALT